MCYYKNMEDIKDIIKNNLIGLRKENKLTQLELAQKIGYSDKAISRWETGETTPDVETLNILAGVYNVPISYFFESEHKQLQEVKKTDKQKVSRLAISLLCIACIWFVAIILFDVFNKINPSQAWLTFIWAIPISFLLAIIFNAVWGYKIWTFIFASIFSWTAILSLYLQLMDIVSFMIFIAGVPIQAIIIFAYFLKKKHKKTSQE